MKHDKKLITILILLLLTFLTLFIVLFSRYLTKLSRAKAPFPQINTYQLPSGQVGTHYRNFVSATLSNTNEDLKITIDGLPDGLLITKCSQEFNSPHLPSPNTQTKCLIEGVPTKEGVFPINLSVSHQNNDVNNIVTQTIDLTIIPL